MLQPLGPSLAISQYNFQPNQAASAPQSANAASSQAIQDVLSISQQGMAASLAALEAGSSGGEQGS
jgi:hypothetical protein